MATQTVVELSKHFGKVKAVDGVSFHVENGEFFAFSARLVVANRPSCV